MQSVSWGSILMDKRININKQKVGFIDKDNKIYLTINGSEYITKDRKNLIVPNVYTKELILNEISGKYNHKTNISMINLLLKYSTWKEDDEKSIISEILKYLETDLLFYRVNSPESLANKQKKIWDNALEKFDNIFNTNWKTTSNLCPIQQNQENIALVEEYLVGLNNFQLFIMFELVKISGSCILTILVSLQKIKLVELWSTIYVDELFNNEIYQDVNKKNELKIKKNEIAFFMKLINSIQS
jgi:chaperone required for assembly of F1-ATPase